MFYNTTGSNNTAEGYLALQNNTTGNNNTAIGIQALNGNEANSRKHCSWISGNE